MKKRPIFLLLYLAFLPLLITSCASTVFNGVNANGDPVYLNSVDIRTTPAFQKYSLNSQSEAGKILFIMSRIKDSQDLSYFHEGSWYNSLQAYRGGMWLFRNRYQDDQKAADFLREQVRLSERSGQRHLIKYPDGTLQDGYYVLLNELARLENP